MLIMNSAMLQIGPWTRSICEATFIGSAGSLHSGDVHCAISVVGSNDDDDAFLMNKMDLSISYCVPKLGSSQGVYIHVNQVRALSPILQGLNLPHFYSSDRNVRSWIYFVASQCKGTFA